jgi:RNA polymerase sigma-70 factor (ECF subfamily)
MNTTYALRLDKTFEPAALDETTMVRLSQKGDKEMFAHLYQAYLDRIYRYVLFRVVDEQLAEDITSQVFLRAWEKLSTYVPGQSPFIAWIYRIAHNSIVDYYRIKKATISIDNAPPAELSHFDRVEEKLDTQIQSQKLRMALDSLTKEQQEVLLLKFVDGLSTSEIAKLLKKQEGAIRALQMRGLQGLAKCPTLQTENLYVQ